MNNKSFQEELEEVLNNNKDYVNQDGSLNRNAIINEALKYSEVLLEYLYSNPRIQDKFFTKIKDVLVFKQQDFIDFISDKYLLAGSYTKYKNKIGLTSGGSYIKQNQEVVLSFPFKDGVLEGGQSNKDEKKNEKFYNEVLAVDEIDRLLDAKVLSNAKLITISGEENLKSFKKDEQGNIKDNLLIKGNNLLVLHSLKENFASKVKLIYIDPPYNTGNDEFKYNDNFNHSTWLVFMKNRLEIAKQLLTKDGVIFIQIDDNEQAYLKVLMDEIFGRENSLINIIWNKQNAQNDALGIQKNHEYILSFFKKEMPVLKEKFTKTKNVLKDERGYFYIGGGLTTGGAGGTLKNRINLGYSIYLNEKTKEFVAVEDYNKSIVKDKSKENEIYTDRQDLINAGYTKIIRPPKKSDSLGRWTWNIEKFNKDKHLIYISDNYSIQKKVYIDDVNKIKNNKIDVEYFSPPKSIIEISSGSGSKLINNLLGHKAFESPKPESLLERILKISTQEGDIVLDFHAGSGTTGAVAHKMGRQYILVEQMDYIENITLERLKKVIAGEQGGVSKAVNWQGGGDFVYLELKKLNQLFIDKITKAIDTNELILIKQEILEKGFIDYKLDVNNLKKDDKDFSELTLEEQKEFLKTILDKNQLYVNYSEREDTLFNCTEEEIQISEDFYKR